MSTRQSATGMSHLRRHLGLMPTPRGQDVSKSNSTAAAPIALRHGIATERTVKTKSLQTHRASGDCLLALSTAN